MSAGSGHKKDKILDARKYRRRRPARLWITIALILVGNISSACCAEIAYVTDQHKFNLRSGESIRHRIVSSLQSGTIVEVLSDSQLTGYSNVRLNDGTEGFIRSRYLQSQPTANMQLTEAIERLRKLERSPTTLAVLLARTKAEAEVLENRHRAMLLRVEDMNTELSYLRNITQGARTLIEQQNALQARVEYLENLALETRNAHASSVARTYHRWLIIGAAILLSGLILGLLLPRILIRYW